MKIKMFNELFDTEEIKSLHDINYLSGNMNKIISNMKPIDFNNDDIYRLIDRIIREVPYFAIFKDEVSGYGFSASIGYIEDIDFYILSLTKSETSLSFIVKINSINNYDAYIVDDDEYGYENLNFRELVDFINEDYKKILIELGFDDVLEYNSADGTINN